MNLRRKVLTAWGLLLPIPILAVLTYCFGGDVFPALGLILLLASFALLWLWSRCPVCGKRLTRGDWRTGTCSRCGKAIDFDAKG